MELDTGCLLCGPTFTLGVPGLKDRQACPSPAIIQGGTDRASNLSDGSLLELMHECHQTIEEAMSPSNDGRVWLRKLAVSLGSIPDRIDSAWWRMPTSTLAQGTL